jgi:hypothetical protein
MSVQEAGKADTGLVPSGDRVRKPRLLGRKSVLLGMLTSGFVIANAAQSSAVAGGTVKPIAATQSTYAPKWAPSTAYVGGQQVVSPNNDVVSANVAHTSSAGYATDTAKWILSSTYAEQAALERNIVTDGATTGAANNATIIQAAIDACSTAGGGTVQIPKGTWLTGPLKLKTRVRLNGEGWGSVLRLVNGANAHLISLSSIQQEQTQIENLWLDGNGANQSAGNWDVVNLDNTAYDNGQPFPSLGDPNHFMRMVSIVNGKRHGVYLAGDFQGSHIESVFISDCDQNSISLWAPDTHLISCVSRRSGLHGFYIAGNSNRVMNCKAFLAGRLDATNGCGFVVANVSRADLTHCEAQDNRQHGFSLNNTEQTALVACRSDRNGLGPEPVTIGWGGDGLYCFAVTNSRLDLVVGDRNDAGGRLQRWAYNCSTGNAGNIVTLTAGIGADSTKGGNGSFGSTSVGYVRWNGTAASGAFA